jgi:hypothetical protein
MKLFSHIVAFVACLCLQTAPAGAQSAQEKETARNAIRERLRQVLETAGKRSDVNVTFRQSDTQPYNFVGVMQSGLSHTDGLEIVISVTAAETIGFRVYPHYKGGYINVDKAKDAPALMRKLLSLSHSNFLFWGIDDSNDVFCGYTITLESGFPPEVIEIVLRSIHNADGFVGEMRALIDGSSPSGGS